MVVNSRTCVDKPYLDLKKSVFVSSPAGSGKTQKLAERYVELLKVTPPERILAITYTEKAAAEMKQRIIEKVKEELPSLWEGLKYNLDKVRISTIHSFGLGLLQRFAFELELDPLPRVIDQVEKRLILQDLLTSTLIKIAENKTHPLYHTLKTLTVELGWDKIKERLRLLFVKIPFLYFADIDYESKKAEERFEEEWRSFKSRFSSSIDHKILKELKFPPSSIDDFYRFQEKFERLSRKFLTHERTPRKTSNEEINKSFHSLYKEFSLYTSYQQLLWVYEIFKEVLRAYEEKKKKEGLLDFEDMEYQTLRVLTSHPQWSNILYTFDENTDHLLIDEFQDINGIQWMIFRKIIEEWKAGYGAKREIGRIPTLFLVGDERQSIYLFRGANVEISKRVKEELKEWMKEEFLVHHEENNYRSLKAIVDFVNFLFSRLMQPDENYLWKTGYTKFLKARENDAPGSVELLITETKTTRKEELKKEEAETIAKRISQIVGNLTVYEKDEKEKKCKYEDIALLIPQRTHLEKYEEAFQRYTIPYVVVKGIGFYETKEISLLRNLISFLANPFNNLAFYLILKSPLFGLEDDEILPHKLDRGANLLKEWSRENGKFAEIGNQILLWLSQVDKKPSAILIEEILTQRRIWSYFSNPQEYRNIKKFIEILDSFDEEGLSMYEINEKLGSLKGTHEESKAHVSVEGMDAVRIMTRHAAKGLDFPVVFVAGIEEKEERKGRKEFIHREEGEKIILSYPDFTHHPEDIFYKAKKEEEYKRLFYVACTRARDALFLSGVKPLNSKNKESWLDYVFQILKIEKKDGEYTSGVELENFRIVTSQELKEIPKIKKEEKRTPKKILLENPSFKEPIRILAVVEKEEEYYRGIRGFGEVMHKVLEWLSTGIKTSEIYPKLKNYMITLGMNQKTRKEIIKEIERQLTILKEKGIFDSVISPAKNRYSEVPFLLPFGNIIYQGRIDRVILETDKVKIYDYKTFEISEDKIEEEALKFKHQLSLYARASYMLYQKPVKKYLIFTSCGVIKEI